MTTTDIPWLPAVLENETVKLTRLTEADFEPLFAIASDPAIWEQHPVKDRYKREVFQQYVDSGIESKAAFLVHDKASGRLIGCTRYYNYKPHEPSIAVGFTFLAKEYWGGKYNKAMKKLLIDEAFKHVNKFYLHVGIDNVRSQTAVLRLGAKKVRLVTEEEEGIKPNYVEFVINKEEWK